MIITKADYGKYLVIKSKLVGDTFEKLSTLPGFKKWVGRDLLFDPTGANIDRIRKYFPEACLLYTSPSPRDGLLSRMPSSA